jgi:hypothetical protein
MNGNHTRKATRHARRLPGWRIKTYTLTTKPDHWDLPVKGLVWWRQRLVEVAWLKGTPDHVKAAVLWHELGHVEQAELAGLNGLPGPVEQWWEEVDAWERGLVAADQYGYKLTKGAALLALRCLISYGNHLHDSDEVLNNDLVIHLCAIAGVKLRRDA